jgi:large subunit ribosomal protein L4e
MKRTVLTIDGKKDSDIELPTVFDTEINYTLIHRAYINLESHGFQKHSTKPTAGMEVVADSNDPPTGRGGSRIAKIKGGGGGRGGQAGEVASTRGGRQAHPPKANRVIYKKLNKKENKLALCSALAATTSKKLVESRGHKVAGIDALPLIISDDIEKISKTSELIKVLDDLKITQDVDRLKNRKKRTGKVALRGRVSKIGKSALFVVSESENISKAAGTIPGINICSAKDLSVLNLAPGGTLIRLTVFSKKAIKEIAEIKSQHLELMVTLK